MYLYMYYLSLFRYIYLSFFPYIYLSFFLYVYLSSFDISIYLHSIILSFYQLSFFSICQEQIILLKRLDFHLEGNIFIQLSVHVAIFTSFFIYLTLKFFSKSTYLAINLSIPLFISSLLCLSLYVSINIY